MDYNVQFIDGTIVFPPRTYGRVSNFNRSAPEVLQAAGFDKLYDPSQTIPVKPDTLNDYAPVYRLDGDRVVFDRWDRIERSLSPLDKIVMHEMQLPADEARIEFTAEDIASVASCFADWLSGTSYKRGNIVQVDGRLYRADHDVNTPYNETSPANPGNTLWAEISDTREEWSAWIQGGGTGLNGTYVYGATVTHDGKRWRCKNEAGCGGHAPSAAAWAVWEEVT